MKNQTKVITETVQNSLKGAKQNCSLILNYETDPEIEII